MMEYDIFLKEWENCECFFLPESEGISIYHIYTKYLDTLMPYYTCHKPKPIVDWMNSPPHNILEDSNSILGILSYVI